MVRRVPIIGIRIRTGRNVPTIDPTVETAYSRPATVPASCTSVTASRTAQGVTAPSAVTGTANISIVPMNEPMKAPADRSAKASPAASRSGVARKGSTATLRPAPSTTAASARSDG
jgi:hypothetical protein